MASTFGAKAFLFRRPGSALAAQVSPDVDLEDYLDFIGEILAE